MKNSDLQQTLMSVEFMGWLQKALQLITEGTVNRVDYPKRPISVYKVQTIIRMDIKEVFPK